MKGLKDPSKFALILLFALFAVGALEIFFYFYFIYKPANALFGSGSNLRLEIPALSFLLKPKQITNESVSLGDEPRKLLTNKRDLIRKLFEYKLANESSFLKSANMDVIVAGKVNKIQKAANGGIDVTLINSTGAQAVQNFPPEKLQSTIVSIVNISPTNPKRSEATLEDTLVGDYMIIRINTDIVTQEPDYTIQVELFRTSQS